MKRYIRTNNRIRARWVFGPLMEFRAEVMPDEELQTVIGDFIADLLHLADVAGLDPEQLIENARMNHEAEQKREEDSYGLDGDPIMKAEINSAIRATQRGGA
jgi:hypothetical protein